MLKIIDTLGICFNKPNTAEHGPERRTPAAAAPAATATPSPDFEPNFDHRELRTAVAAVPRQAPAACSTPLPLPLPPPPAAAVVAAVVPKVNLQLSSI